jgi:hypothetical protein
MKKKLLTTALFLLLPWQTWAEQNEYLMTDICRATLHIMLDRDLSIMKATSLSDGSARVQYTRPQDGKAFSYRCRSIDGSTLGILDETIAEPRWYGEQPRDTQRSYRVREGRLIIHTFHEGSGNDESFSHVDFPVYADSKEGDNEALKHYGTLLAGSYSAGKLKLIKAYHVTKTPMNAYRLDFETSEKALLSQPGGDENPQTHDVNEARATAWRDQFCSSELKKIMRANSIDLVSGFTFSKGKRQLIAPCF